MAPTEHLADFQRYPAHSRITFPTSPGVVNNLVLSRWSQSGKRIQILQSVVSAVRGVDGGVSQTRTSTNALTTRTSSVNAEERRVTTKSLPMRAKDLRRSCLFESKGDLSETPFASGSKARGYRVLIIADPRRALARVRRRDRIRPADCVIFRRRRTAALTPRSVSKRGRRKRRHPRDSRDPVGRTRNKPTCIQKRPFVFQWTLAALPLRW